eukprot:364784-Chlamydomonas_euryale.AAC.19
MHVTRATGVTGEMLGIWSVPCGVRGRAVRLLGGLQATVRELSGDEASVTRVTLGTLGCEQTTSWGSWKGSLSASAPPTAQCTPPTHTHQAGHTSAMSSSLAPLSSRKPWCPPDPPGASAAPAPAAPAPRTSATRCRTPPRSSRRSLRHDALSDKLRIRQGKAGRTAPSQGHLRTAAVPARGALSRRRAPQLTQCRLLYAPPLRLPTALPRPRVSAAWPGCCVATGW